MHEGTYIKLYYGLDDNYTIQYWGRRLLNESDSMNLAIFMKFKFKGD